MPTLSSATAGRLRLLVGFALSAAMLGLLLTLGFWQLERAHFKEALDREAQQNAGHAPSQAHRLLEQANGDSWYFRPVRVTGRLDPQRQYLLDNRTSEGKAGYHVLSVMTYGTHHLLVNRGWLPVGPDRRVLPDVAVEEAQMTVTGLLAPIPDSGVLLGDSGYSSAGWPKVVQRVELESMKTQLGSALLPALVLLDPDHPACFGCRWVAARGISAERHRGYAVQWFALAVAFVVLLGVASIIGARRRAR